MTGRAFTTFSAQVKPAGCPPATIWSSFPGQVAFALLRRATQSSNPSAVSTYPLICTPARLQDNGLFRHLTQAWHLNYALYFATQLIKRLHAHQGHPASYERSACTKNGTVLYGQAGAAHTMLNTKQELPCFRATATQKCASTCMSAAANRLQTGCRDACEVNTHASALTTHLAVQGDMQAMREPCRAKLGLT